MDHTIYLTREQVKEVMEKGKCYTSYYHIRKEHKYSSHYSEIWNGPDALNITEDTIKELLEHGFATANTMVGHIRIQLEGEKKENKSEKKQGMSIDNVKDIINEIEIHAINKADDTLTVLATMLREEIEK